MEISNLPGIVITFVVIAIILGMGATILTGVNEAQCDNAGGTYQEGSDTCANETNAVNHTGISYALNATHEGHAAIAEFSGWQTTIAIIVVAAVVIGTIGFFYTRRD